MPPYPYPGEKWIPVTAVDSFHSVEEAQNDIDDGNAAQALNVNKAKDSNTKQANNISSPKTNPAKMLSPPFSCQSPPITPKTKKNKSTAADEGKANNEATYPRASGSRQSANPTAPGLSIKEQVAGALLGSTVAEIIVYPFDTLKLLQQIQGLGTWECCQNLMATQGVAGFYRGMPGRLFQTVASNGMFFFLQTLFKNNFKRAGKGVSSSIMLNMLAQQCNRLLTTPLDVAANIHQTDPNSKGFIQAMIKVVQSEGLKGLWKGLGVSLLLSTNPALMFTLVDKISTMLLSFKGTGRNRNRGEQSDRMLSAGEMFFVSGTAKMVATLLTYPLIRAKTIMQTVKGASPSLFITLARLIKNEGLKGMYVGVWMLSWKTVLFNALMMAVKQKACKLMARSRQDLEYQEAMNALESMDGGFRKHLEVLGDMLPYQTDKTVVYIDGGWSYLHPSHQHILAEAQSYGDVLIVGVHDEETRREHGDEFAERYDNRLSRIRLVRGVDAILHHAPWTVTAEMMRELNISKVLSGYRANTIEDTMHDPYAIPKALGVYTSLADPYSGMWRNIARVMFSNVDSADVHHDSLCHHLNDEDLKVGYLSHGMFRCHSTGHFTVERTNSFYFYHDSSDQSTFPSPQTRRGRHLAIAQHRRDHHKEEFNGRVVREHRHQTPPSVGSRYSNPEDDFANFQLTPPADASTTTSSPMTTKEVNPDPVPE